MSRRISVLLFSLFLVSLASADDNYPRWVTLFDGTDLSGWTYAKSPGAWKIEAGAMTQTDKVDFCSIEEFENCLVEVEFRSLPTGHGNSGVYVRGVYEVQIYNSTHGIPVEKLQAHHGGGIYGQAPPSANPHKPQGEWNRYRILMIGKSITVWINDVMVQDGVKMTGLTGGPMPVSRSPERLGKKLVGKKGPVMLQGDHDKLWFRNIRVLSLPDGWKPLWNGKDFSEFTMRKAEHDAHLTDFWAVTGDGFYNPRWGYKENRGFDLWTRKSFGNFLVHYEYRSEPTKHGGNSGFYLRDQWEIQIESRQQVGKAGDHKDGSLYSTKGPDVLARTGPREWNVMDVKLVQNRVTVWQNGQRLHDDVTLTARTDNKKPTKVFSRAAFKLQGDHGQVWLRHLFIRELPDSAK